ncbi:hypothetical protein B9G55_06835 [Saccharibacillus sp. O16]|nr:hypothetical protein B9G55_06835 [Saccharibacillus sp. O16]
MRNPKIRGLKRRTRQTIRQILTHTSTFPEHFEHGYWHLPIPADYRFLSANTTPRGVKRRCLQALLNQAVHLAHGKPHDSQQYRVIVAIDLPNLWSSQIIIFADENVFQRFFQRSGEQQWLPLPCSRSLQAEWGLSAPDDWQQSGFMQVITYADGNRDENELWFIGEFK